jgi:hypothetical protein
MSAWDSILGAGERIAGIGAEVGAHALEAIPGVGSIPALIHGAVDSDHATDARLDARVHSDDAARVARDHDTEDYYNSRQGVDLVHAIPLLGAGLEAGELIAGGVSALTGGGFEEGMERQTDGEAQMLDWITGTPAADVQDRTAQRHRVEAGAE